MAISTISSASPAKINLSLQVTGRRAHLHTIRSVMTLIDFADNIVVSLRRDGKLRRGWRHRQVRADADLTMRAAALLQVESGVDLGADIVVQKRIPIGGGLGGGSSNAATVLLMLNQLWNVGYSSQKLMRLARQLGSDTSFFIRGYPSMASGVGERLRKVQVPSRYYLLVLPKVCANTAAVYAEYDRLVTQNRAGQFSDKEYLTENIIDNQNDLAAAAFSLYPKIATAARLLQQMAGQVYLSGSGACVYAPFNTAMAARKIQQKIPTRYQTVVSKSLLVHPLCCN